MLFQVLSVALVSSLSELLLSWRTLRLAPMLSSLHRAASLPAPGALVPARGRVVAAGALPSLSKVSMALLHCCFFVFHFNYYF